MEDNSMSGNKTLSGSPFSLTTLVAILTCAGGLIIASRKISSDRPAVATMGSTVSIGDQTESGRLWADPFDLGPVPVARSGNGAFSWLRQQAQWEAISNRRPALLTVFLRAGPFGENREARIRTRFAVVSALGEAGYVPEDQDRIGAIDFAWPTSSELRRGWLTNDSSDLWISNVSSNPVLRQRAAFEWYRDRVFRPGRSSQTPRAPRVLVLWVEEDQFADVPAARFALLLQELAGAGESGKPASIRDHFGCVLFLGPRSSSTLRALLPDYGQSGFSPSALAPGLRRKIAALLHQVEVYSPTASAMDAALVSDNPASGALPRQPVEALLTNLWFHSFHNFCATDSRLAAEALDELKLRGVDLSRTNVNLVVVSEWDTFYGRMLSLTYAAELACLQGIATSDHDFVVRYQAGQAVWPANLFSFVHLNGLDGQTTGQNPGSVPGAAAPATLEALKHGNSDENLAQGPAQLDYLTRLGRQLLELQSRLERQGRGRIAAIGIVGSDVYDTLVILQALRGRFPNAVFFTTDLDARYLHPKELEWSRNLLVVSGYGLRLRDGLQGGVAPFRDSMQTAQFAATLAALGSPVMPGVFTVSPRRTEVGRGKAFDLSTTASDPHPPPPALDRSLPWPKYLVLGALLVAVSLTLMLVIYLPGLQRLTRKAAQFELRSLWFRSEDVGGRAGLSALLLQLRASPDPRALELIASYSNSRTPVLQVWETADLDETRSFLDFLNEFVFEEPANVSATDSSGTVGGRLFGWRFRRRQMLDELFTEVLRSSSDADLQALGASAHSARQAAEQGYWLRHSRRRRISLLLLAALFLLIALVACIVHDQLGGGRGEPFSLLGGVSVWPTQFIRLLAVTLSGIFLVNSHAALNGWVLDATRRFRLPMEEDGPQVQRPRRGVKDLLHACAGLVNGVKRLARIFFQSSDRWQLPALRPHAAIHAGQLWKEYQQLGCLRRRLLRTIPPFCVYVFFCIGVARLAGGAAYRPVRGGLSDAWDITLLALSVAAYLFLAFWTIDAVRLCRWLVEHLSQAPTRYPKSCLQFFARQCGLENPHAGDLPMLAEWIDMQLIAGLTERVGRLVYYPFLIFFLLLLSRNNWWDRWVWPPGLLIIFSSNLLLSLAGMLILQRAALQARERGLIKLRATVAAAEQRAEAPQSARYQANVGRRLIQEVETLEQGAFAPFWQNPVVGALLIPSGGSVLVELLDYLFH